MPMTDPSIIAGLKPPQLMTPADAMGIQNMLYRNQLAQMQMGEMQQETAGMNVLAAMYQNPQQNIDPATGMPRAEAINSLMGKFPAVGMAVQKNMLEMQQKRLQAEQERATTEFRKAETAKVIREGLQKNFIDYTKAMTPIEEDTLDRWQSNVSKMGPKLALEDAQAYYTSRLDKVGKTGGVAEDLLKRARQSPWNPDSSKENLNSFYGIAGDKLSGPTAVLDQAKRLRRIGKMTPEEYKRLEDKELAGGDKAESTAGKILDDYKKGKYGAVGSKEAVKLRDDLIAKAEAPSRTSIHMPQPTEKFTDEEGKLWEKERGGSWKPALLPSGKQLGTRVPRSPEAEQLYKDYSNDPQVKKATDLEVKIKPLVDYMIDFSKTGKSVNANDAALAKAYLAVTTSYGNRAYTMDKKELSKLPNLGDRLGNIASSFFSGKDLTDQTRKEMFDYIVQSYKASDAERKRLRDLTIKRATARGVTPKQIFGTDE